MDFHDRIGQLSEEEFLQIRAAATWYANFHARMIAERLDDPSAMAVGQRERHEALLAGLRKLGARVHDPTVPVTSLLPAPEPEDDDKTDSRAA
jgi:hypothetical protein